MPKPDELTTAAALRAKATKALDTMRARIVKADEARTEAAHQTRAAQVAQARDRGRDREHPRGRGVGCRRHLRRHASGRISPRRRPGRTHPPTVGALSVLQSRAAPVTLTPRRAGTVGRRFPRASAPPPGERAPTRARTLPFGLCHVRCPCAPVLPAALPRGPLCRGPLIPIRQLSVSGRGITPTTNRRNDMATNNPDQPVAEVRLGRITATIWRNRTADDDGVFYSTQITRLYRRDEKWERSHAFGRDDLLTVAKVADMANTRIPRIAGRGPRHRRRRRRPRGRSRPRPRRLRRHSAARQVQVPAARRLSVHHPPQTVACTVTNRSRPVVCEGCPPYRLSFTFPYEQRYFHEPGKPGCFAEDPVEP